MLRERCPDCGFDCREPARADLPALVSEVGRAWVEALGSVPDARVRPAPAVWSPLEYGCHVRDVLDLAAYRVSLMLDEDEPRFANWDQDATAIDQDYASDDPGRVSREIEVAGREFARVVASVPDDAWHRRGRRGDGAEFTVESFTRYLIHDPVHHLTDVTGARWA